MNRRAFLAAVTATGLAGCTGREATPTATASPRTGNTRNSLASQGFPPNVCSEALTELGIVPIDDPAYGSDWADVTPPEGYDDELADDAAVVGIEREGRARAYPVSLLWHHEIVNETFPDGTPLLVTYCSICRSGMVAERRVDGQVTRFGVSGLLWRPPRLWQQASEDENRTFGALPGNASADLTTRHAGNLVMYDALVGSYWSQVLARGLCGPHAREPLTVVPSTLTTWAAWRRAHPEADVLLPPPASRPGNPPYPGEAPPGTPTAGTPTDGSA